MKTMYIGLNEMYWAELEQYGEINEVVNRVITYMVDNDLTNVEGVKVDEPIKRRHIVINNPDYEILCVGMEHSNDTSLARLLTVFVEGGYGELEGWQHCQTTPTIVKHKGEQLWQRNYYEAIKCISILSIVDEDEIAIAYIQEIKRYLNLIKEEHDARKRGEPY